MRRKLFTLTAFLYAVTFIAVSVLWVASYRSPRVIARHDFGRRAGRVSAAAGTLELASDVTDSSRFVYPKVGPTGNFAGFGYGTSTLGSWVTVPLWFVFLAAATACLVFLRFRGFASGLLERAAPLPFCSWAQGS